MQGSVMPLVMYCIEGFSSIALGQNPYILRCTPLKAHPPTHNNLTCDYTCSCLGIHLATNIGMVLSVFYTLRYV